MSEASSISAPRISPLSSVLSLSSEFSQDDEIQAREEVHAQTTEDSTHCEETSHEWQAFKIVGDNIDKTVCPRHQTTDTPTQSLHSRELHSCFTIHIARVLTHHLSLLFSSCWCCTHPCQTQTLHWGGKEVKCGKWRYYSPFQDTLTVNWCWFVRSLCITLLTYSCCRASTVFLLKIWRKIISNFLTEIVGG